MSHSVSSGIYPGDVVIVRIIEVNSTKEKNPKKKAMTHALF